MATQIQLQSTNYNGQIAAITFYPCSGGTISLGNQTIPYTYTNNNYQGTYDLYFSAFNQTCQLVITCLTPTPTTTTTPTVTPTITPTNTQTPSATPTITPTNNPLCPEQVIVIDNDPFGFDYNGTYDRLYSYTGGTFIGGTISTGNVFTPGPYLGNLYAIYGRFDGTRYYTLIYNIFNTSYVVLVSNTTYIVNTTTSIGATFSTNQTITDGSVLYPKAGFRTPPAVSLEYPISCPTPTPTITPTNTPGLSPTPTMTPTPSVSPGPSFDPDAAAYLSAVVATGGTVTSPMSGATNNLFLALKSNGLYSKMKAFYPVLGGIAASHSINGNLNTSFNLTFNGTFVHSSNGFNSTSSTSYAGTNYVPLTQHPAGTMSLGCFANSNINPAATDTYLMGVYSAADRFIGWDYFNGDRASGKYLLNSLTTIAITPGNPFGFAQLSSDGTTKYFSINKNGVEYAVSAAKDGTTLPDLEIYISNLNVLGAPYTLQQGRVCFAYMGDYLTTGEMTTLSSIINAFQTSLGRNTY